MRLKVATRFLDLEPRKWHVLGTGPGDQHVVDRCR